MFTSVVISNYINKEFKKKILGGGLISPTTPSVRPFTTIEIEKNGLPSKLEQRLILIHKLMITVFHN